MSDIPSGTIAFLVTDIEGSTRLWEAHPAAMAAAYIGHDALLRASVEANAGHAYKVVGEAYQVAFATASAAAVAALDAQLALSAEGWVDIGLPVPVARLGSGRYGGTRTTRVARHSAIRPPILL